MYIFMRSVIIILFFIYSNITINAQWEKTNGYNGGYIPFIDKLNDSIICFPQRGQLFYSMDSLKTWNKTSSIPTYKVFADSYALNGINCFHSFNGKIYIGSQHGLYISEDFGKTFYESPDTNFHRNIFEITTQNNQLYILAHKQTADLLSHYYLYKSEDGINWLNISEDETGYYLLNNKIKFKWGKIYATSLAKFNSNENKWNGGVGVQVSDNDGKTWRTITKGIDPPDIDDICFNDSIVFVSSRSKGIYFSIDEGENWNLVEGNGLPPLPFVTLDFETNDEYLLISIQNYGLFRSDDNGLSWEKSDYGIKYLTKINSILIDKNCVFVATDIGIYKSENYGQTWISQNDEIRKQYANQLCISEGLLLGVSYSLGLHYSNNQGNSWINISENMPIKYSTTIEIANDTIYLGGYMKGGLFLTNDLGNSWTKISNEAIDKSHINKILKTDKYLWCIAGGNLYRSSDIGNNWEAMKCDSCTWKMFQAVDIVSINNMLFAISPVNGIIKSIDGGINWDLSNEGITDKRIFSIAYENEIVVVGTQGGTVFLSEDEGNNWKLIYTNNDKGQINSIIIKDNNIVIGERIHDGYPEKISSGLKISRNKGTNWYEINDGLENEFLDIMDLVILDDYIYASIAANGVWKAKLSDFDNISVEDEKLIGNYLYAYPPYPLPAKDYVSSEIYWDTKLDINSADMAVYNLFGDKICGKEKINLQQKTIWSGTVTWDASSAPPGLYLLRIKHGTKTETIKMLIE